MLTARVDILIHNPCLLGLKVCRDLGIPNAVIEVDVTSLWDGAHGVDNIVSNMAAKVEWCRTELSPDSRVLFNLRDFQYAWPTNPDRLLAIVERVARLGPGKRPFGLMIEDQNGSYMPAVMDDAVHAMRRVTNPNPDPALNLWGR